MTKKEIIEFLKSMKEWPCQYDCMYRDCCDWQCMETINAAIAAVEAQDEG